MGLWVIPMIQFHPIPMNSTEPNRTKQYKKSVLVRCFANCSLERGWVGTLDVPWSLNSDFHCIIVLLRLLSHLLNNCLNDLTVIQTWQGYWMQSVMSCHVLNDPKWILCHWFLRGLTLMPWPRRKLVVCSEVLYGLPLGTDHGWEVVRPLSKMASR